MKMITRIDSDGITLIQSVPVHTVNNVMLSDINTSSTVLSIYTDHVIELGVFTDKLQARVAYRELVEWMLEDEGYDKEKKYEI